MSQCNRKIFYLAFESMVQCVSVCVGVGGWVGVCVCTCVCVLYDAYTTQSLWVHRWVRLLQIEETVNS